MDAKEREFGKHFANTKCSVLHAQWAMDAFWGEVTHNVILPGSLAIYDALVQKGITAKKKIDFNDADDTIYYIPTKSKKIKVFVHTTQSIDFLYVMNEKMGFSYQNPDSLEVMKYHELHIRRIYRELKEDHHLVIELETEPDLNKMLRYADTLNEYHDDHYRYSQRPSLKAYKKVDFQIPYHPKDREKERDFYGDYRDGGYILSYDGRHAEHPEVGPRVDGSVHSSFTLLTHISTIYLSCIADELGIKVPKLDGYR